MENTDRFLGLIKSSISTNWDKPAFSDYNGSTLLFKDFAQKIAELHIIFETIEVQKGDKIALCGRNCTNWAVTFFAAMSYGAVVTTILHDFDGESIHNIVNHCDAKVFFVGEHVWDKVDPLKIPNVKTIITIEDYAIQKSRSQELNQVCDNLSIVFKNKYPKGFSQNDLIFHQEQPEEMALINYTSGTTSKPKGVMIPYRSLWSNTKFAIESISFVKPGDGIVSMLPMAHMYGLAFEILLSVAKGCHVHFLTRLPSPQIIMGAFEKVKPTLIIAVPLIIEKIIVSKVFTELNKQPTKTLIKIPFIREKIFSKVKDKLISVFGGQVVEIVVGGAALDSEVGKFLSRIKFPYTVGYGMTECGPLISYDFWETYRATSCGKPVDRMEVKIDSPDPQNITGEIMVRGTNTMLGYYKNPEATADVLASDGWLRTGDLGVMDESQYVYIKGRSKTMILGPSGQNIYPEEIEQLLNNTHYVAESLIVEREGRLHALIFPDQDAIQASHSKESIENLLKAEITNLNKRLPKYSQIADYTIQKIEFDKTPKRSIKRFLYK
ncbi:long-chain fatty acid--CoA ligase [Dysgonomonas sp. HDW5B]|uniref:AMP-binding protein n=1 Tax=Dysgonomonas sp. HDW5B TaxID=2714927 RepID=UPI001407F575|nr:AMP-binding protein [Dysgonomonas sp. HDW5B]QIK53426.1 long-chain fatty acid--CoA ligase [Dysgonomonas sp. HDW5B]